MKTTVELPVGSTGQLLAAPSGETAEGAEAACGQRPEIGLRMLADRATHARLKAWILARLVSSADLHRRIVAVLRGLPDDELLEVLDELRLRPLGNGSVRRLGLRTLVGHERFAELATQYRPRLTRIVCQLLGTRAWTTVRRRLRTPSPAGDRFLHARVLRLAADPETARDVLCFLAGIGSEAPPSVQRLVLILRWLHRAQQEPPHPRNPALRRSVANRQPVGRIDQYLRDRSLAS